MLCGHTLPSATTALFTAAALHDVTGIIGIVMVVIDVRTIDQCMTCFRKYYKPAIVLLVSPKYACSVHSLMILYMLMQMQN